MDKKTGSPYKRIERFLGSYRLSVVALIAWFLMVLIWLVAFNFVGVPDWRLRNIVLEWIGFRIIYILFAVNLTFCMIRRIRAVSRQLRQLPSPPASAEDILSCKTHFIFAVKSRSDPLAVLADFFEQRRYRIVKKKKGLVAYRRRFSPLGNLIFHLGFYLLFASILVSATDTFIGKAVAVEGQYFRGTKKEYTDVQTSGNPAYPAVSFFVEKITPAFFKDILLFTSLESDILFPADTLANKRKVSLANPIFWDWKTIMNIEDFGYAPKYVLLDSRRQVVDQAVVKLRIFPSGSEDSFLVRLPNKDKGKVLTKVYSDYAVVDGKPVSKSFNLKNPVFQVRIVPAAGKETKKVLAQGRVPLGDGIKIENYTLVFSEVRYYGLYRIISSPSIVLFLITLVLLCTGLIMRILFRREEYLAYYEVKGRRRKHLYLAKREDFFKPRIPARLKNRCLALGEEERR